MQNIEYLYDRYIKGKRITTDSRTIHKGDVFIALKGENFNGNRFALQAIESGASVAFVDDSDIHHELCIQVADTLVFLQEIASYHRHRLGIPILGITGTNGKTTTKELCHAVLSVKYKTFATQGNFNNHIGVPLTLLSMDENTEFGIVEMGASHPGEIKSLCDIADPDYGIITNIGQGHLEGFGTYNTIIETKKQLYEHIQTKNGQLFVNSDDPLLMKLSECIQRHTYGKNGNHTKGEIKQSAPFLVYSLKTLKGDLYIRTHLIGGYNFDNAMAASCVGLFFGISPLEIQKAIENYQPSNLRSQLLKTERNTIILDAYNANPSSMKAALANFSEFRADNKMLVLGEMGELGEASETAHKEIFEIAQQGNFSQVILIGNSFAHYGNNVTFIRHFPTTDEFIVWLKSEQITTACILVKGSRKNRLERIVEYL